MLMKKILLVVTVLSLVSCAQVDAGFFSSIGSGLKSAVSAVNTAATNAQQQSAMNQAQMSSGYGQMGQSQYQNGYAPNGAYGVNNTNYAQANQMGNGAQGAFTQYNPMTGQPVFNQNAYQQSLALQKAQVGNNLGTAALAGKQALAGLFGAAQSAMGLGGLMATGVTQQALGAANNTMMNGMYVANTGMQQGMNNVNAGMQQGMLNVNNGMNVGMQNANMALNNGMTAVNNGMNTGMQATNNGMNTGMQNANGAMTNMSGQVQQGMATAQAGAGTAAQGASSTMASVNNGMNQFAVATAPSQQAFNPWATPTSSQGQLGMNGANNAFGYIASSTDSVDDSSFDSSFDDTSAESDLFDSSDADAIGVF